VTPDQFGAMFAVASAYVAALFWVAIRSACRAMKSR
jgi:hypothetical protein